jgi:hypothetical protein
VTPTKRRSGSGIVPRFAEMGEQAYEDALEGVSFIPEAPPAVGADLSVLQGGLTDLGSARRVDPVPDGDSAHDSESSLRLTAEDESADALGTSGQSIDLRESAAVGPVPPVTIDPPRSASAVSPDRGQSPGELGGAPSALPTNLEPTTSAAGVPEGPSGPTVLPSPASAESSPLAGGTETPEAESLEPQEGTALEPAREQPPSAEQSAPVAPSETVAISLPEVPTNAESGARDESAVDAAPKPVRRRSRPTAAPSRNARQEVTAAATHVRRHPEEWAKATIQLTPTIVDRINARMLADAEAGSRPVISHYLDVALSRLPDEPEHMTAWVNELPDELLDERMIPKGTRVREGTARKLALLPIRLRVVARFGLAGRAQIAAVVRLLDELDALDVSGGL